MYMNPNFSNNHLLSYNKIDTIRIIVTSFDKLIKTKNQITNIYQQLFS